MTQEFIELNLDTKKCPLGQLSLDQLTKGKDILEEARKIVHMKKPDVIELNKLTNQYYSNIPHNFGYSRINADVLRLDADDKIDKAFDILDVDDGVAVLVLGASLLLTAVGVDRTPHQVITPVWYLLGAAGVLYGVFDIVEGTAIEILFLFAAAGLVYLSVALHSRTLLFVATAGILAYTAWFTGEHLAESVGWPIALIIFGLLLIGLSALALRIDRNYVRAPAR